MWFESKGILTYAPSRQGLKKKKKWWAIKEYWKELFRAVFFEDPKPLTCSCSECIKKGLGPN